MGRGWTLALLALLIAGCATGPRRVALGPNQ